MLLNYKVDPDIHDFRLLHPVITLYSPAKANFVKVYFSVVSIEVSKMSENTGKSHENKMVIIDCGNMMNTFVTRGSEVFGKVMIWR